MDKSSLKDNKPVPQNPNKKTVCEVCRSEVIYVFVHGHYQCPVCKQVVLSCCEGNENCYPKNPKNS